MANVRERHSEHRLLGSPQTKAREGGPRVDEMLKDIRADDQIELGVKDVQDVFYSAAVNSIETLGSLLCRVGIWLNPDDQGSVMSPIPRGV
jgi:hypothetical protein